MSVRTERVGALIRDELSYLLQRSPPEYLDGMVTIVSVKMSPDLRIAKVYVSIYRSATDPDIQVKRMNTHAPELRRELASRINSMRFLPELRFYRDDTLDAVEHIDKLLDQVRRDDEARGLRRNDPDGTSEGSGEADA